MPSRFENAHAIIRTSPFGYVTFIRNCMTPDPKCGALTTSQKSIGLVERYFASPSKGVPIFSHHFRLGMNRIRIITACSHPSIHFDGSGGAKLGQESLFGVVRIPTGYFYSLIGKVSRSFSLRDRHARGRRHPDQIFGIALTSVAGPNLIHSGWLSGNNRALTKSGYRPCNLPECIRF